MTAVCEDAVVTRYTPRHVDPRDTLGVLRAAREWLADSRHWARSAYWITTLGGATWRRDLVAATCAVGALSYVAGVPVNAPPPDAVHALTDATTTEGPVAVNDRLGYAAVIAMYDAAIARLEEHTL